MSPPNTTELACREMVELVTDYLEDRLPTGERAMFDAHLSKCGACTAYVAQMRATLAALGRIPPETLSPAAREMLVSTFADFQSG